MRIIRMGTPLLIAIVCLGVAATSAFASGTRASHASGKVVGNVATGKKLFASSGCTGCHTLKAAGAKGTVGPNLDKLKPAYAAIVKQVTNGGGGMPAFKGKLSTAKIQDVAAFVYTSTH